MAATVNVSLDAVIETLSDCNVQTAPTILVTSATLTLLMKVIRKAQANMFEYVFPPMNVDDSVVMNDGNFDLGYERFDY